jgi:CRISPR-associated endonuclease/helicase Cas3
MDSCEFLDQGFAALTDNSPLRWQRRLFEQYLLWGEIPTALDIPTGLGKTSVITIWLLALAWQAANGAILLPRRLLYVVNRRTVVDQATDVAMKLRDRLRAAQQNDTLGRGDAKIHVVELPVKRRSKEDVSAVDERLAATKDALQSLPHKDSGYDASPQALRAIASRTDAFSRSPRTLPLTDILLDAWSLTRLEDLPGRPHVERWLHGVEGSPPDLYVAWREEVNEVAGAKHPILRTLYDQYPILARECLRGPLTEVVPELQKIAKRTADRPVRAVLIPANGDSIAASLAELLKDDARLREATMVLPPQVGGLDERGMLDGSNAAPVHDVADKCVASKLTDESKLIRGHGFDRMRVLLTVRNETGQWTATPIATADQWDLAAAVQDNAKVREKLKTFIEKERITLAYGDETGQEARILLLFALRKSIETAQDNPAAAPVTQTLDAHLAAVRDMARGICDRLGPLTQTQVEAHQIAEAIAHSAQHHDRGKDRDPWQADIGNPRPQGDQGGWNALAKSGRRGFASRLSGAYRHEFGSLREAAADQLIEQHPESDLILHLIAAHHGWARPHFKPAQWDIADGVTEEENAAQAADTMRRFARLQRRFGHWGLAWLESLMRAADYAATERLSDDALRLRGTAP